MRTEYDERKFTELLLHVAARLRTDRSGDATKLNKVMFFADFAHVRRLGSPVTGADLDGLNPQVSELSHEEAGWRLGLVDVGRTIPYEAALVGARQVSTPTSQRLERAVEAGLGLLST